MVHYEGLLQTD